MHEGKSINRNITQEDEEELLKVSVPLRERVRRVLLLHNAAPRNRAPSLPILLPERSMREVAVKEQSQTIVTEECWTEKHTLHKKSSESGVEQ